MTGKMSQVHFPAHMEQKDRADFESCRFDFRIDSKNGLTPSRRKKAERKGVNNFTLFKCKVCGSLFDSRPALLEHKVTHNKFKCVFCDARFARQSWMMEHVALMHGMGELPDKLKSKLSSALPRILLPKPMEDIDLGTTAVLSDSESEPPSPLSSPLQKGDCLTPPVSPSAALSPGAFSDMPKLPDLLSMGLSFPFPFNPPFYPISPQSTCAPPLPPPLLPPTLTSPVFSGLPPSQLLTSPPGCGAPAIPPLLPAPATPTPSSQVVPLSIPNSTSGVPCIYINVPILISSESTATTTSVTPAMPVSASSSTSTATMMSSSNLTSNPMPSLLPVNPFTKRDIAPSSMETAVTATSTAIPFKNNCDNPEEIDKFVDNSGLLSIGNVSQWDDRTNNPTSTTHIQIPLANFMSNMNPLILLPGFPTPTTEDQCEALDFSVKNKTENGVSTGSPNSKNVFSTGIQDPSATLCSGTLEDEVVDLSRKPKVNNKGDDCHLMQQQYTDNPKTSHKHSGDVNRKRKIDDPLKYPTKSGPKKSSIVLDKMVQKLWQSKMETKDDGEDDQDIKVVEVKEEQSEEPLNHNNSSFGRVYVLNELPKPIETFNKSPSSEVVDLSGGREMLFPNLTENMMNPKELSDIDLKNVAASISSSVMLSGETKDIRPKDEQGFCAIKFHTCRVCKQLFYTAEEMWEHAVTHQDFHKYRCNQCPYVTACHRELVNHRQAAHSHDANKDNRYICTYPGCMKTYSESRYLKEHQKAHHQAERIEITSPPSQSSDDSPTKNERLVCEYAGCFKTFKEWRHLKVHQTLHTGEKPLSCQLCTYACRHRSSMNWHMKSKHGLEKKKTQGNRTVYVDCNKRVVCGWSDEANREVNYLKESAKLRLPEIKYETGDTRTVSDYSNLLDNPPVLNTDVSMMLERDRLSNMDCSTSVSLSSSRPPSCAPSENPSERSLMDDPHMLMLKMQSKPSEFPLNMSVQIEDLSPKEQIVGEDGRLTKLSENSDKFSDKLTIDVSQDGEYPMSNGTYSPSYPPSTVSSSLSSSEASVVASEGNRLVMTPVAYANINQGTDHQASMMKFKLKYLVAPKYFPCKVCNQSFENAVAMWEHRIEHHKDVTRFFCDSCRFDTESMTKLQSHMMSTHGKELDGSKDFICFICGKGYATRTGLNQHMLRHSEEGPPQYDCPYENCLSKVHSKSALKNHIRRVHLKVPAKYQCSEEGCMRRFDSQSALSTHQVLHTSDRPLICDYPGCDKSFRESKHLRVHIMQHTDEKPIKCDICDYSCRQRNSMNWHMKSKHNREKGVSQDGKTIYIPITENI